MATMREAAEGWLKHHEPKCACCGNDHFWFTGIEVSRIYPEGYVDGRSFCVPLQTARFVCNNPGCGTVMNVDCVAAHIAAQSVQLEEHRENLVSHYR